MHSRKANAVSLPYYHRRVRTLPGRVSSALNLEILLMHIARLQYGTYSYVQCFLFLPSVT